MSDATPKPVRRWCIFLADLHGGGAERMMVTLAAGFAQRGIAVDLVLASATGPYLDEVPDTVRIVDLGAGRVVRAIEPLARYLRSERPELVFTTLQHVSLAALVARWRASSAATLILREATTPSRRRLGRLDAKRRLQNVFMRAAYAAADGVVAVSEGVADDLHASFGVPRDKLWTLYSPLVTDDLAERARETPTDAGFGRDGVPVLLAVGTLRPYKGFRMLLDAVALVRREREVRLVVLGEGEQREDLERHARELGIDEAVSFVGFRPNPFAYMARADLFVLSSEREGLPGALIQAMACGCPVVATDCPSGPAEVLEEGAFGRLVPVGDATAMADAILATLREPRDAERLHTRAARFASGRVIDAHVEAFERAVQLRGERLGTASKGPA